MKRRSLALAACMLALAPSVGSGQGAVGRSFELATLQQAAIETDPRMRQFSLLTTQTDLRLRNIAALRLPAVTVEGQAQYQSDVAHLTPEPPVIGGLFPPSKETYDGSPPIHQRLFDPTGSAQGAIQRAPLAEKQRGGRRPRFTRRPQRRPA